jgi:hypothetical protein
MQGRPLYARGQRLLDPTVVLDERQIGRGNLHRIQRNLFFDKALHLRQSEVLHPAVQRWS